VESVNLTIGEDFHECTVAEKPLSVLNPKKGGGSVVVVEVKDEVAYQIYDATSDAVTIAKNGDGVETSATAAFEYTFEEGQDEATLLVYVKFGPGLKGMTMPDPPADMCMNTNSAKLEVFEQGQEEPVFEAEGSADAWLKVVEKAN
jgi:hypothetical protein